MSDRPVVRECAQKNGQIDENSNEDKEQFEARSCASEDDVDTLGNESPTNVVILGIGPSPPTPNETERSVVTTVIANQPPNLNTNTPPNVERKKGFNYFGLCNSFRIYSKQMDSVVSGFILFLVTGLHIMWGVDTLHEYESHKSVNGTVKSNFCVKTPDGTTTETTTTSAREATTTAFVISIYYVGAMIGSVMGALLVSVIRKRIIYDMGAAIGLVSNMIFLFSKHNVIMELIARMCAGVLHGLVYITIIIHAGENASKYFRHTLLLFFGSYYSLGIFIGSLYDNKAVIVVPVFIYIVITVISTHVKCKESPIYLLQHQKVVYEEDLSKAFDTFVSLQKVELSPEEVGRKFDEIKTMLAEESSLSRNIFADGNFKALFICLSTRLVGLLSFNLPLITMVANNELFLIPESILRPVLSTVMLWFCGGLLTITIVHKLGKKHVIYLFASMFGISTIFIRLLFIFDVTHSLVYYLPNALLLFYFYIVSLPLEVTSNVCLSEAFPTPKKPFSIVLITVIEHFVHILLVVMYFNGWTDCVCLVTSLGLMTLGFKIYWSLPKNTDGLSLQQSVYTYRSATSSEWYSQANTNNSV